MLYLYRLYCFMMPMTLVSYFGSVAYPAFQISVRNLSGSRLCANAGA